MKDQILKSYYRDKNILVTGGTGFIGSHLVEQLVSYRANVTILDNLSNSSESNIENIRDRITLNVSDVTDVSTYEKISQQNLIFNLAATSLLKSFNDPFYDLQTNIGGTIRALQFCRKWNAKLVQASTGSVYGNPTYVPIDENHPLNPVSPYGVSKLSAESYCRLFSPLYNLPVVCLRYFNVYGPRQRIGEETGVVPIFMSRIYSNQPISIFGDGEQTRDFLHVSDCVRANLLAGYSDDSTGKILNIGGPGEETSIIKLARTIMEITGIEVPMIFKNAKPGDIDRLVADSSKAKDIIGYTPEVLLRDGLNDYASYAANQ